ncbi:hypothetical protein FSARC_2294 [Fusarium sarcochroum]|uniref:C2H2-type domain-containing protein n=1 Tax=Fusarium sarcochroum TaxID=1208366 RepID=A0A8H4U6Y7_9HYPO|nr:hypothetical protein FSARC_2294 [Fusarium sarcochroum]
MTDHMAQDMFQDRSEMTFTDNDFINCLVPYLYGQPTTNSGQVSTLGEVYNADQCFVHGQNHNLDQNFNSGQCHPLDRNVSLGWDSFPISQRNFINEGFNKSFDGTAPAVPRQLEFWRPINQGDSRASNTSQNSANETPTQTPTETPSPPPPMQQDSHDSSRTPSPPRGPHKPRRLVYQRSDMPQGSEEQVIVTRNKRSSVSPEPTSRHNSRSKPSSGVTHSSRARKDQESGQGRRGSPASQSGQANSSAPRRRSEAASKCAKLLNVPLPSGKERQAADLNQSDVELTNPSAAYLDYCINKELSRRKQIIVDNLMAAISECFERRLEALEEGCDPHSGSHPSSSAFQAGKQTSRSAGQKRSNGHHSRDESENEEDDDGSYRRKKDSKRTKTTKDDTRPRFACPYHQRDPKRFGAKRTCCGPGWHDISRVKEHLERSHSLPPHQCHRCLHRFKKEEDLKKHQREKTPCPVKEPNSIQRNLLDGYDEEQAKKLKPRSKKDPVEKWKEMYCVLFDVKPGSPDIPSPYHDPSTSSTGGSPMKPENVQEWREYCNKAKPVIRRQVTMVVAKAFDDCEPQMKSNVLDRLQDLPRLIAERLPFPGLSSEETSTATDDLGFFSYLDSFGLDDYGEESFDFQGLDDAALFDSSNTLGIGESSDSSDAYQAGDSSATSVGDDTTYQQFEYKPGLIPTGIDFGIPDNRYC